MSLPSVPIFIWIQRPSEDPNVKKRNPQKARLEKFFMENHSLSFLFFETRRSIDQHIEQTLAPSSLSPPHKQKRMGRKDPSPPDRLLAIPSLSLPPFPCQTTPRGEGGSAPKRGREKEALRLCSSPPSSQDSVFAAVLSPIPVKFDNLL